MHLFVKSYIRQIPIHISILSKIYPFNHFNILVQSFKNHSNQFHIRLFMHISVNHLFIRLSMHISVNHLYIRLAMHIHVSVNHLYIRQSWTYPLIIHISVYRLFIRQSFKYLSIRLYIRPIILYMSISIYIRQFIYRSVQSFKNSRPNIYLHVRSIYNSFKQISACQVNINTRPIKYIHITVYIYLININLSISAMHKSKFHKCKHQLFFTSISNESEFNKIFTWIFFS